MEVIRSDFSPPALNAKSSLSNPLLMGYLDNLQRLNKSEHTIKNYRADLLKFMAWLKSSHDIDLSKVNGEIIGEYREFLNRGGNIYQRAVFTAKSYLGLWFKKIFSKQKDETKHILFHQLPMSVSSRRRHLSSIKNFYEYLKESHEDKSNKFSKNPVKSKIHAITLKEVDVVPTAMISRENFKKIEEKTYRTCERLMLYLLYYGGLRLSELCYLKITDFDLSTKTITFKRKGGHIHTFGIQKEDLIFKNLKFMLENEKSESIFLFHNKEGRPYCLKAMYNKIMKIINRADIIDTLITPHSFRKACATELYLKSKDLLFVRDYLNHKDAKVTQTYIDKKTLSMKARRYH